MITKFGGPLVVLTMLALGTGVALGTGEADTRVAVRAVALAQPANCAAPAPACAPCAPTITYRHHGFHKVCCDDCTPPIETALELKDPCGCGTVIVPVCLPGCCTDVPQVSCHCGLLGRGVVRYDYCCGFIIKIIFRHTGDIVVHYIGA